jgi:hypothetical protein
MTEASSSPLTASHIWLTFSFMLAIVVGLSFLAERGTHFSGLGTVIYGIGTAAAVAIAAIISSRRYSWVSWFWVLSVTLAMYTISWTRIDYIRDAFASDFMPAVLDWGFGKVDLWMFFNWAFWGGLILFFANQSIKIGIRAFWIILLLEFASLPITSVLVQIIAGGAERTAPLGETLPLLGWMTDIPLLAAACFSPRLFNLRGVLKYVGHIFADIR